MHTFDGMGIYNNPHYFWNTHKGYETQTGLIRCAESNDVQKVLPTSKWAEMCFQTFAHP